MNKHDVKLEHVCTYLFLKFQKGIFMIHEIYETYWKRDIFCVEEL